jgi:hypothetical protein
MATQELIEKFNNDYNVQMFDVVESYSNQKRFSALDDFSFQKQPKPERVAYYNGLKKLLEQYVENNTKMTERGVYDLSKFDVVKFVDEYEAIVSGKLKENGVEGRKPYEGIKRESLVHTLVADSQALNMKMSNIWSKNILKGKMTMAEMERITDSASATLNALYKPGKKVECTDEQVDMIGNIMKAKVAMQQVRKGRNFFWKLFMRKQNNAEKAYIKKLEDQIAWMTSKSYPTSEALMKNWDPVLRKPFEAAENFKATEAVQENIVAREQLPINELKNEPAVTTVPPVKTSPTINAPTQQNTNAK